MPHVAVIGQVLRSSQTRNGNGTIQNNNNNNTVGVHQGRGSTAEGITPAWNIPEHERKFQNGAGLINSHQVPPLDEAHSRQLSAYRRWMTKNKVAQSGQRRMVGLNLPLDRVVKLSSTSTRKYRETPSAAVVLYMGIGMFLVGLVITFVGVGEKGFQTLELQLIGPCLTGLGLLLCGIRVVICCFCASRCSYCDELIRKDDAVGAKSPSASSGRSLPPNNRVHAPSAMLFNGKRAAARAVTPFTSPPSTSKPHMPSTSTRTRVEHNGKSHSWDSQSLDLHFNQESANGSARDSPSFLSDSDEEDGAGNKFQEIELRKAVSPTDEPERPFSRDGAITPDFNQNKNVRDSELASKDASEPVRRDTSELERRTVSAKSEVNEVSKLSNGLILDPQQYLTRATMAALNSHNKL